MNLGHSRDAFLSLVGSMDLVTFWACHRAAFAHFGGVPREILYDRTKTIVRCALAEYPKAENATRTAMANRPSLRLPHSREPSRPVAASEVPFHSRASHSHGFHPSPVPSPLCRRSPSQFASAIPRRLPAAAKTPDAASNSPPG
jgi:hypothetical protein